jgi:hypothetical protein
MDELGKQLIGIDVAERMLKDIVSSGIYSANTPDFRIIQVKIRELNEYKIPGIQAAFTNFLLEIINMKNEDFHLIVERINYLYTLLTTSKRYLNLRNKDPHYPIAVTTAIEEQIGKRWTTFELKDLGLWEADAEIIQLSFNCYGNTATKEWTDMGIWLNMKTGEIHKTINERPFLTERYLKADNTVFDVLTIKEMYLYPGNYNRKIRWFTDVKERGYTDYDLRKVRSFAAGNYEGVVLSIKQALRNPLEDKDPVALVALHEVYLSGEDLVIEDKSGNALTLKDSTRQNFPATLPFLSAMLPQQISNLSLVLLFNYDVQTGLLSAQPLSLITPTKIIRLLY